MANVSLLQRFFLLVYGDTPTDKYLVVVTSDPKTNSFSSRYVSSPESAIEYVQTVPSCFDVYVGTGLQDVPLNTAKHGTRNDVTGLVGLHIDLDVGTEGHKKDNLPPTIEDALATLQMAFPATLTPTLVVFSGHGLQCWWLFHEPWLFADEEDRLSAEGLLRDFQYTIRRRFEEKGWGVDSTCDIARILRVPGTVNNKVAGVPVATDIYEVHEEARYFPASLMQVVCKEELYVAEECDFDLVAGVAVPTTPPVMSPAFAALYKSSSDLRFQRSVHLIPRDDLKDTSASGHDQSLANLMVLDGMSGQECADAFSLIESMRNKPLKRQKYYLRTIARAIAACSKQRRDVSAEGAAGLIHTRIGLDVKELVQFGVENAHYRLVLADGRTVHIPSVTTLATNTKFRERIVETLGVVIPRMKPEKWDDVVKALMSLRRQEGDDFSEQIHDYLHQYLTRGVFAPDAVTQAVQGRDPFVQEDGCLYLHPATFTTYINLAFHQRYETETIQSGLADIGFWKVKKTVRVNEGEKATFATRMYWVAPWNEVWGDWLPAWGERT